MSYYPIFVELAGRACLVVGGGAEAARKVSGLLAAGGEVTVISPRAIDGLCELQRTGRIAWIPRSYQPGDVVGFQFVIVATNDRAANQEIYAEARAHRIWVNATDDPERCDFIVPAVIRTGAATVAVSTSTASPALARRLREELADYFAKDSPALNELVHEVRGDLARCHAAVDEAEWQQAVDRPLRALVAQRRHGQAKARLLGAISVAPLMPTQPRQRPLAD